VLKGTVDPPNPVLRHNMEKLSSMTLMIAFSAAMFVLGVDVGLFRMAHDLFHELPNSRTAETEGTIYFLHRLLQPTSFAADLVGLRLASKACYDPRAAPK
jgi:metalloendopeptidase OMA1, mitochondrial